MLTMNKIKLLLITDEMEVGGSQRQIVNILKNIDTNIFEPHLVYFRYQSYLVDDLISAGVPVTYIGKTNKVDFIFLWKLYQFIKKGRFDLIHAFSFTGEVWGALAHSLTFKGKFLSSVRGTYEWYSDRQWYLKKLVTIHSHYVISNSQVAGNYAFNKMNINIDKLKVVHNGLKAIDKNTQVSEDVKAIQETYKWTIAFVGRLVDHKNLPCLIKSIKLINDKAITDMAVIIIGDGPDMDALQNQAKVLDLSNIFFLGERHDVQAILKMVDAAVLPSFREGLSNTILEAMAAGLPVIASAVGGTPEIIEHDKNGLLFCSNNENELAEGIIRLYSDSDLSNWLGMNAKSHIQSHFSMDTMIKNINDIYTSAINLPESS